MTDELRKALDTIMAPGFGATLSAASTDTPELIAMSLREITTRARRLGLNSAANTIEFVADALEHCR
jgi:hypothetical protein